MTTQLLATELANLIQESKRKHNDLRQVRRIRYTNNIFIGMRANSLRRQQRSRWKMSRVSKERTRLRLQQVLTNYLPRREPSGGG
jgi:hypothetical protein